MLCCDAYRTLHLARIGVCQHTLCDKRRFGMRLAEIWYATSGDLVGGGGRTLRSIASMRSSAPAVRSLVRP
eukprot:426252-Rhodomonas_salina.2